MTVDALELSDYDGTPERLFLFQMGTDVRWGYLQSSRAYTYLSVEYSPMYVEMGDISQALSESSPTVDIQIDADAAVAQQFVPYMPILPIRVRVYRHHFDDPDDDFKVEMIGEVVSCQFDEEEGKANLSCRMVASNLDRKVPWPQYQKPCNYALYGAGCRINPDDYKTETTAGSVIEERISSADFAAVAALNSDPKWFVNGFVRNRVTKEIRFVIDQEDDVLYLQAPFVGLVTGDLIDAFAGCDRSRETCHTKFDNLDRWLGFGWIPEKNPFVDNVYGTGSAGGPSQAEADKLNRIASMGQG